MSHRPLVFPSIPHTACSGRAEGCLPLTLCLSTSLTRGRYEMLRELATNGMSCYLALLYDGDDVPPTISPHSLPFRPLFQSQTTLTII